MVLEFVEVAHADFTKITQVIFIHEDSVVVLTTRHTATGRMLAMLANSTVTSGDVSALLAVFLCLIILKKELGEKVLCQPLFLWEWVLQKKTIKSIRAVKDTPPQSHTTALALKQMISARQNFVRV